MYRILGNSRFYAMCMIWSYRLSEGAPLADNTCAAAVFCNLSKGFSLSGAPQPRQ